MFGVIAAGSKPYREEMVQLGSVQTLARRLPSLPTFDLIVTRRITAAPRRGER